MKTWRGNCGKIGLVVVSLLVSATAFAGTPGWGGGRKGGTDVPATPTGEAAPGASVPLKLYRHPQRGYVSVANEASEQELLKAGYQFVRVEGYVLTGAAAPATGSSGTARTVAGNEHAYLRIRAAKQGMIKGSGKTFGHQEDIVIQGIVSNEAARQLKVIKQPDGASPKLSQALQDQEPLSVADIIFARTGSDGKESDYETMRLKGAQISAVDQRLEAGGRVEEVAFSYQCLERVVRQGGNVITSGCDRR